VIFQTGKIAGTELELNNYIHVEKRFVLNPLTEQGVNIPQGTLIPAAGDKYAVFHINLPDEYIEAAETELLNEAVKFLYENEHPHFTYTAQLDKIYAKQNWLQIGGRIEVGRFIRLTEPQYLTEPVNIRIVSIKDYVNAPYSPEVKRLIWMIHLPTSIRDSPGVSQRTRATFISGHSWPIQPRRRPW
jgi:hypothetical protein